MPSDFTDWLSIATGIMTIVSFALYIGEKHKRERQADLMLGFMHGIKALINGMAQAGNEWRYRVDEKPEGYSRAYGNTCTNTWITLSQQIDDMIARLSLKDREQSAAGDPDTRRA